MCTFYLTFVLVLSFHATDGMDCRKAFVRLGDECFWFSRKSVIASWTDAQTLCENIGGQLAVIASLEEDNYIREYLLKYGERDLYWVGASDIEAEDTFKWIRRGKKTLKMEYTNWSEGQPDNWDGHENCVELKRSFAFKWNDNVCNVQQAFICQQTTKPQRNKQTHKNKTTINK